MQGGRRQVVGAWGEEKACWFLVRHGFSIVERNFHATMGEIDIVAVKGGDYYFIEVKTRADASLATDLAITRAKRIKLNKTIKYYCYRRAIANQSLILASLVLFVDSIAQTIQFRFTVLY